MGQVIDVRLSCYMVLISLESRTSVTWPVSNRHQIHISIFTKYHQGLYIYIYIYSYEPWFKFSCHLLWFWCVAFAQEASGLSHFGYLASSYWLVERSDFLKHGNPFNPKTVLVIGYCRCLRLSVRASVWVCINHEVCTRDNLWAIHAGSLSYCFVG